MKNTRRQATAMGMDALGKTIATMAAHSELDVNAIFDEALAQIVAAFGDAGACLHLHDDEENLLRLVAAYGLEPRWHKKWALLDASGEELPCLVQSRGRAAELLGPKAPDGLGALCCVPVRGLDVQVGVVSVLWTGGGPREIDPQRLRFLGTMGDLLAVAIEHYGLVAEMIDNLGRIMELKSQAEVRNKELDEVNKQLRDANARLVRLSITDGLTGLYNHRYIHQRAEEELKRSGRSGNPLTVLMADLDHFKGLNDKLGHLQGDEALRRFAKWFGQGVRQTDLVGRFGGEEFMAVLINCDIGQGLQVAEKIRAKVENCSKEPPFDVVGGFTVSIGAAQWQPGQSLSQLVDAADKALYQAKSGGRNRVGGAG